MAVLLLREAHACFSFLQVCLPEGILEEPEQRVRRAIWDVLHLEKRTKTQ